MGLRWVARPMAVVAYATVHVNRSARNKDNISILSMCYI